MQKARENMRQSKEYKLLNCKLEKNVSDMLEKICAETGLSKTVATERAIREYYENYKKTGKV